MFYYKYDLDKYQLIKFPHRDETVKGDKYTWVKVVNPDDIIVQITQRGTVSLRYIADLNEFLAHYKTTFADVCMAPNKRKRLNSKLLLRDHRITFVQGKE